MKICILSREYPPQGLGWGSSWLYQKLAREYVRRGHCVHVICQAHNGATERCNEGVIVHEVGDKPTRGSPLARLDWSFHAIRKMRQVISRFEIEVVDAPLMWAEGLIHGLRKNDVPLVLLAHGWADMLLETHSYGSVKEWAQLKAVSLLERLTVRKADRVMANSRFTASRLIQELGVHPERVALIYEHIEVEKLCGPLLVRVREQLQIGEEPLILYAGFLEARKGIEVLAEAFPIVVRHLPTAKLVVIGRDTKTAPTGGSFRLYVQTRAKQQGWERNLFLLGYVPDDLRTGLFNACDLFVFPSLCEPFGKPVLEAMACNRPVVATATGIAAELVGLSPMVVVIPARDKNALAHAIIRILSVPREERERLASSHRRFVEDRFSFGRVVEQTLEVYSEVIAERVDGIAQVKGSS